MSFQPVRASSPGKIILAGEHAVVHGTRALATVIDKRMYATVTPNLDTPDTVTLLFHHPPSPPAPPTSSSYSWPLPKLAAITAAHIDAVFPPGSSPASQEPDRATLDAAQPSFTALLPATVVTPFDRSCQVFLLYFCFLLRSRCGVVCEITSDLPISAGLGSSASFCSSLAAAFYAITAQTTQLTPAALSIINAWAFEGERMLHGTPSGVDNTCCVYGGVVCYQRGKPLQHLPMLPPLRWLVVNTNVGRDTKTLVAGVRERVETERDRYWPMIQRIDAIVGECIAVIQEVEASSSSAQLTVLLSPLIRENQQLLTELGVSHPAIAAITAITADAHACPSKLTGAGGGGCVLVLLRDNIDETELTAMTAQLNSLGYDCLQAVVGQGGVRGHEL